MKLKEAREIAGSLGKPSKMPGTSYGISAKHCITGSKLAKVEGSTCSGCYALKANYIYPSVQKAHDKRESGLNNPLWSKAMAGMLKAAHMPRRNGSQLPPFHRWHDSGDLQSEQHLQAICDVAALTPELTHWLPTREIGIVSRFVKSGGIIPANLTVRVSATMIDGAATKAWPLTSGVHSHELIARAYDAEICPAPTQGNECKDCRKCWDKDVAHVSYHVH